MGRLPDADRPHIHTRRDLLLHGIASAALLAHPRSLLAALNGMAVTPEPGRPWLDVARKAETWLAASARRDSRGLSWPVDPDKPAGVDTSLYTGMPGVVLFQLELHHATGERRALEAAVAGAEYLAATLPPDSSGTGAGLYSGLAGVAWTLGMTARVARHDALREAALRAHRAVLRGAKEVGGGVEWDESTDIISGSAGIGLYLLWMAEHEKYADALALARRAGLRLMERGEPARGGTKWLVTPKMPRNYPNFSHGAAGVSYFLASLHRATKEGPFLEAALAGARYLDALASPTSNGGRMVFHSEPGNEQLFYLSWCHGPAGTARLYHRLGQLSAPGEHRARVTQLAQAIQDMKVPERSPGFWNNISQCCGNSGVVEFFVDLHRTTRDARDLAFAERVAADTLARGASSGDGLRWVQAENRVSPDQLVAQTGLMQGAAGVGLAMLHLDGALQARKPLIVLPDNPF